MLARPDERAANEALISALLEIDADPEIFDKRAAAARECEEYERYIRGEIVMKGDNVMHTSQQNLIDIAKAAVRTGTSAGLRKIDLLEGIRKRAAEAYPTAKSKEIAFSRCIQFDEIGKTLHKAMGFADGPEVEPAAPVAPTTRQFHEAGPNCAAMQVLADDHLRANPVKTNGTKETKQGAFATVYTSPANAALRERCKQEQADALRNVPQPTHI